MNDPTRLVDDPGASDALKDLLGSARDDGPTAADLARLASKLGPLLVATVPVGAAAATSGAAGSAAAAKGTAAAATGLAAGGGVLKVALLAAVGGTVIAAGAFQAGRTYQAAHAPPPAIEKVAVATPPPPPPPAPAIEPEPEPVEAESVAAPPEPLRKPVTHATRKPEAPPAAALTEVELLEQAMAAMKAGDPKGALALTAQHQKEFGAGALIQEREMLAIEALLKLGKPSEARLKAEAFRKQYPTSSHLLRLDALVGR